MLPVMEDKRPAQRWARTADIDSVAYSAVCGTGLDTVPLPGDITEEQLAKIFGMSHWRGSGTPLSARLQPVKGRKPATKTDFDSQYLFNPTLIKKRAVQLRPALATLPFRTCRMRIANELPGRLSQRRSRNDLRLGEYGDRSPVERSGPPPWQRCRLYWESAGSGGGCDGTRCCRRTIGTCGSFLAGAPRAPSVVPTLIAPQ